ncbi:MAG: fibrobacter succinogenes major paralogous domain-containing protein [Chitinispirillales bacterium]|jgi:uncharacterized protein (TIGR02145 family)|nr:fibrobacter succinogenes major paralogous domain-containing protein [Chitinispirillales bacterium]
MNVPFFKYLKSEWLCTFSDLIFVCVVVLSFVLVWYGNNGGDFTDVRDGKKYKTVKMPDGKRWMAENLNYQPSTGNSWCYNNSADSCSKYGRLYDWAAAMNIESSYNSTEWGGSDVNHQGVCPAGWHLLSDTEWDALVDAVGSLAGRKLKSTSGWYDNGNGTDDYGFSALPGGYRSSSGNFWDAGGSYGRWWTATERSGSHAYYRYMYCNGKNVDWFTGVKGLGFSVRCAQDVRQ